MSVIIKGMDMPKSCGECLLRVAYADDTGWYSCYCLIGRFAVKPSETDLRDGLCPLEEAEPVKHGHWKVVHDNNGIHHVCPYCGEWRYHSKQLYCGYCGACMKDEGEE